jgi:hypothetical protein
VGTIFVDKSFKRSVISFLSIEFKMDSHIKVNSVSIKSLLLQRQAFLIIIQYMIKNYKTSVLKKRFLKLISRNSRATGKDTCSMDYRLLLITTAALSSNRI